MICSNTSCSKEFESKTHNQKYCSDECCRIATNRRIMDKYYEKKAIKNGAVRLCKKCKSKLSRYNSEDLCASCNKNQKNRDNLLKEIVDEISKFS
jgi:hypothetical protein